MKKCLFLFSCVFATMILKAQSNGKLAISAFISPDYSYRSLTSSDSLSRILQSARNDHEKALYTYTTGVNVSRKLFGPIAIETGISYSKKGYIYDSTTSNFSLNQTYIYNFLQIPLKLKIFLPSGKRNFYISAGVSGMMLIDALRNSIVTKNGIPSFSEQMLKDDVVKKFNYNILFGFGLDYQLTKRLFFKLEPNFSKTLESIRKDNLRTYLFSIGINVGLLYVVRKK